MGCQSVSGGGRWLAGTRSAKKKVGRWCYLGESRAAAVAVAASQTSRDSGGGAWRAALVSPAERTAPGPQGGRRPITFLSGRSRGEAAAGRAPGLCPRSGGFVGGNGSRARRRGWARDGAGRLGRPEVWGAGPDGGLRPAASRPEVGRSPPAAWAAAAALCARTRLFLLPRPGALRPPGVTGV